MRQIILDTETTGLSPQQGHRLIEIGCLEMVNRRLTGESFHYYVNPGRPVDPGAIEVHGITDDFLKDKPTFKSIVKDFKLFIQDSELIIHNAAFDIGFIENELNIIKDDWKIIENYCHITCTLEMARAKHPGQRNNLDALCKRYKIDNTERQFHGALLDASILAKVYLAMTGGQVSLDLGTAEEGSQKYSSQHVTAREKIIIEDLGVTRATAAECAEHAAFMAEIKK